MSLLEISVLLPPLEDVRKETEPIQVCNSCGVWGSGAVRDAATSRFKVVHQARPGLYPQSNLHISKRSKESEREAKGAAAAKPLLVGLN